MGKMSKYGSSIGGDERNPYVRRYKSTSNPPKASSSNASFADRRGEPESLNRPKYSGSVANNYQGTGRYNAKNKLRSPVKTRLGQPTNRLNRSSFTNINKEEKKNSDTVQTKSEMTKMKPETESSEQKQKTSTVSSNIQPEIKESVEQVDSNKQQSELNNVDQQSSDQQENGSTNGLNGKEAPPSEDNSNENEAKENGKTEQNGKEEAPQIIEKEEEEFNLHLEAEENSSKPEMETPKDLSEINTEENVQNEIKASTEQVQVQEGEKSNVESCSVDVVESTTSEVSEAIESTAPSEVKDKDNENHDANSDAVSYDSSIMLKDVKIKLNDCLKDPKNDEESNVEQSLPAYTHKNTTFGKTLRTISGRSSIDRMRHITVRDRQPSPNSSLFVNTSNVSIAEHNTSDYRVRHRNTLSELTSSNGGTPIDRKRKLTTESSTALKKPKTEDSSFLNNSIEFLKYPFSPRRPVQVSTPYKFQTEKRNLALSEEIKANEAGTPKKWCVIM